MFTSLMNSDDAFSSLSHLVIGMVTLPTTLVAIGFYLLCLLMDGDFRFRIIS